MYGSHVSAVSKAFSRVPEEKLLAPDVGNKGKSLKQASRHGF
jgi:hypothetical protein